MNEANLMQTQINSTQQTNQLAATPFQTTTTVPVMINQQQLAEMLGKSIKWAERARHEGNGPKFIKAGRSVLYRTSDVLEWLESNVRSSTADKGEAA